jgi:tetratricopeptide (TPR) repeat protein
MMMTEFTPSRPIFFLAAVLVACTGGDKMTEPDSAELGAKIAISTSSPQARELYLKGRDLADKLRATEGRVFFEQATEADPDFALAHLALANSATSAQEFFDALEQAVERADNVSEGERLMILGRDAGARSDPAAQKAHYVELVERYPQDERSHQLLGGYYFGRQEYGDAIGHFNNATEVNPDFSPAYNLLGYAYRGSGRFDDAEAAFKRYIELIPDEPNPYDSYAELLMKMGRFEESITNYETALAKNPTYVFSLVGIGHNLMLLGRPQEARETFQKLYDNARNDGERRTALFWNAASYVHQGSYEAAQEQCRKMQALDRAAEDWASLAGDLVLVGNIQVESGQLDRAMASYTEALEAVDRANVNDDVKQAARRNQLYQEGRLALAKGDIESARAKTEAYAEGVSVKNIPAEVRRVHELQGLIALRNGDGQSALSHFEQANQQDPRVLFEMARAARAAGDLSRARELARQAADFNQLDLNFAFVRDRAKKLAAELG